MGKEWLYGKTLGELKTVTAEIGAKPFAAKQIADWLYNKDVTEIGQMSNLSLSLRDKLSERYVVGVIGFKTVQTSTDGTKKYLYPTAQGQYIESVYIPDDDRATLCISVQAGCRMGCKFCMTGRQGFTHNLSAGEILNQIRQTEQREMLSNVVYMGMGEPLDNSEQVLKSIEILTAEWGYAWSPSRITLSSIGVLTSLKRYLEESKAHLTISLHAAMPQKRLSIMPVEQKNGIRDIVAMIRQYDFAHQRRVSFAYTMFKGVNDTQADVEAICELLRGIPCRINIIPFHQIPDSELRPAARRDMERFRDELTRRGYIATIRTSRGEDIDAACGLLSTKEQELE